MARTKQTARKNIKGARAAPRKSNAGKKAAVKLVFVDTSSSSSSNEDVLIIKQNLDKMKLPELRKILKEYKIAESDIQGSGKGGNVLKSDIILAIKDHSSREHDGKPMTLKSKKTSPKKSPKKSPAKKKATPKKKKATPKKKTPKKKATPKKKKKPSPIKVLTIVSSPKGMKVPSVDKLTAVQALEALKTYKQFQGLSDYEVKKKLGVTKVADIRQALRALMDNPGSPVVALKKKVSPKKSLAKKEKKKKASPKKSPPKKEKKEKKSPAKKKSPPKKKASPKGLKCADKEYDRSTHFCNTKTGKIGKLTKKGRPHGEEGIKGNIGTTYTFNEKYGFVGSEEDVEAHIQHVKKTKAGKKVKEPKEVKKSSPPKKTTPPKKSSPPKKKKTTPKKATPPKKVKAPPKKTNKKVQKQGTPVKPKTPVKTKRACAAGDMESFDGYDRCDIGEVCNAMTGKCIDDTEQNRTGLSSLMVDGRDIIGDRETIQKLHKHLGGKISAYKEATPKKTTPKKTTPPRTIKSTKEAKEKKKATPKKSPAKSPKKSPLKEVKTSDGSTITLHKGGRIVTKNSDGTMVTASREDIYRTFTDCLASLK